MGPGNSPGGRPLEPRLWDSPGGEAKPVPILGLWFSESCTEEEDGGRKILGKIYKSARTVNWEKVLSGKYPTEGLGISISVPARGVEPQSLLEALMEQISEKESMLGWELGTGVWTFWFYLQDSAIYSDLINTFIGWT